MQELSNQQADIEQDLENIRHRLDGQNTNVTDMQEMLDAVLEQQAALENKMDTFGKKLGVFSDQYAQLVKSHKALLLRFLPWEKRLEDLAAQNQSA